MNENRCVACGEIVPEGRQLCPSCVARLLKSCNTNYGSTDGSTDGLSTKGR